jgi:hypothetical protein
MNNVLLTKRFTSYLSVCRFYGEMKEGVISILSADISNVDRSICIESGIQ